jgi:hypothetical protein
MNSKNETTNEGKQLALLERIASAVEFMAGMHGHQPKAPAQSPAGAVQTDAAKQESASE